MIIYRASNTQVFDAPVTSAAVHKATLMKEDYIKLSFVDVTDYHFKAGDYVTWEGQNYYLNKDCIPTMKDEATYSYDLQFNAPWYNLDSYIFFFNTYVINNGQTEITKRESDWYITDTAANIISLLIKNTQDQTRDCPCVFDSIFYCEGTTVKTFTFSSTSILAALNNLAKEFELEWWVEVRNGNYYLHFGECDSSIVTDEDGNVIFNADGSRKKTTLPKKNLTSGATVSAPSISSKNDLKKKYFVYGSSRNIDQTVDMLSQEDGTYVSSLVTKRLAMEGNPQHYIPNAVDPIITEDIGYGEEVVIFDDIYPRSDYKITHVSSFTITSDEIEGYDTDGNPVYKTYDVFQVRLGDDDNQNAFSDYVFELINDPQVDVQYIGDVVASGKVLSLKFIIKDENGSTVTPILAGFEFELGAVLNVNIPPEGSSERPIPEEDEDYEWYEFQIIKQDINGYIIPNNTLKPEVDDWVCLFNIKGAYIKQQDNVAAQAELRDAFKKYYKNLKKDVSYTVKPYVNTVMDLNIGDSVRLNYPSGTVRSRISSFEKKLDYTIDASYTISSFVQPSTVNQLKEEVKTITANIASGRAFQLDAEAATSILNTYGSKMFLYKSQDDTAYGKITFSKGVDIKSLTTSPATVTGTFGTPNFISGFVGQGWQVDSDGNLTIDNLTVRQSMRVFELLIQQVKSTGGEIIVSPANGKIKSILGTYSNKYICELESENNNFGNMFVVNDLVRCQRWTKSGGNLKNYWVRVSSVSGNTIELEGTWTTPNVPYAGDELVLMGNTTNTSRQAAISITATDDGKPRITVLNGIGSNVNNPTSLDGCTRAVLGDLSSVTDNDFGGTLSGYGIYSDRAYLKGKMVISNGVSSTEIGAGFFGLKDGVTGAGINLENGTLTLASDKTTFKNSQGDTLAVFTDDGIQSSSVQCVDEDGNLRTVMDINGTRMYYPLQSGQSEQQVMKEEIFLYNPSTGSVTGTETRYYDINGNLLWRVGSAGEFEKDNITIYWTVEQGWYQGDHSTGGNSESIVKGWVDLATSSQTYAQGDTATYTFSGHKVTARPFDTTGVCTNCFLSKYTNTNSTSQWYSRNGDYAYGDATSSAPTAPSDATWLTGWIMLPLNATTNASGKYVRHFKHFNNGKLATALVRGTSNTASAEYTKELTFVFDPNTGTTSVTYYIDIKGILPH